MQPFAAAVRRVIQDVQVGAVQAQAQVQARHAESAREQERLVYRAQLFLRDYVGSFSPSLGDLDYPNRLIAPAEEVRAALASRAARGGGALNTSLRARSQKNGTADAGSGKGASARRAGLSLTGGPAQLPQRPQRSSRSWCVAGLESPAQCPTPRRRCRCARRARSATCTPRGTRRWSGRSCASPSSTAASRCASRARCRSSCGLPHRQRCRSPPCRRTSSSPWRRPPSASARRRCSAPPSSSRRARCVWVAVAGLVLCAHGRAAGAQGPLHSQLFLIMHLLILRDQVRRARPPALGAVADGAGLFARRFRPSRWSSPPQSSRWTCRTSSVALLRAAARAPPPDPSSRADLVPSLLRSGADAWCACRLPACWRARAALARVCVRDSRRRATPAGRAGDPSTRSCSGASPRCSTTAPTPKR